MTWLSAWKRASPARFSVPLPTLTLVRNDEAALIADVMVPDEIDRLACCAGLTGATLIVSPETLKPDDRMIELPCTSAAPAMSKPSVLPAPITVVIALFLGIATM